jgi:hypothetical protein
VSVRWRKEERKGGMEEGREKKGDRGMERERGREEGREGGREKGSQKVTGVYSLRSEVVARHFPSNVSIQHLGMMMMSFICSYRNKT